MDDPDRLCEDYSEKNFAPLKELQEFAESVCRKYTWDEQVLSSLE